MIAASRATTTKATPTTVANTDQTQGSDWLLRDLNYILDYCIQEGDYDEADRIAALVKQAEVNEAATRRRAA